MAKPEVKMDDYNREATKYKSPYERWKESEGLPTIRGYFIKNLLDVDLTPWKSGGDGLATFVNLEGTGGFNDTYICEIAPGKSLKPHRHLFEETIYILKGQGATSVWLDEKRKQTFEWQEGSYFAMPMNSWHEHFNVSGREPVRFVAMTSAPRVLDTFNSWEFVFDNPFVFRDRFTGDDNYFQTKDRIANQSRWETNFVPDVRSTFMVGGGETRGKGTKSTVFCLVNNTMRSHSSSWPVGTYKKAHRHGPGIHIVILRGQGYSLMWLEGQPVERIDWQPGSMFVPPEGWFHQHFNTGNEPVLFLAIGWGSDKPKPGGKAYVYKSVKEGGDQIEYEDEDPNIHRDFEAALAKAGAKCEMPYHPLCTQK